MRVTEPELAPRPAPDDGEPPPTPPRWGIGDAIAGWFIAQAGAVLAVSLVLALSGEKNTDDLSLGWMAVGQTGLWLGFFCVPWVATRLKGNGMVADLGLRTKAVDLWGVVGGVVLQFAVIFLILTPIVLLFGLDDDDLSKPARELADRATDPFGVIMLVLIVGVGAPVFEEIFYRGFVQRAIERRLGPLPAIAITAVVFGISHLQWLLTPGLVAFGAVVGILAQRTGRLGPAIATHVGFNLTTVFLLLVVE